MKIRLAITGFLICLCHIMSYSTNPADEFLKEMSLRDDFPLKLLLDQKLSEHGNLDLMLYTSTKDPNGLLYQKALIPFIKNNALKINFQQNFVSPTASTNSNLGVNQDFEKQEALRQLAIQNLYPDSYIDYLYEMAFNQNPWEQTALKFGLDVNLIKEKATSTETLKLYQSQIKIAEDTGAQNSLQEGMPLLTVNDSPLEISLLDLIPEAIMPPQCCDFWRCFFQCAIPNGPGSGVNLTTLHVTCGPCIESNYIHPTNPLCWPCLIILGIETAKVLECFHHCLPAFLGGEGACSYNTLSCEEGEFCLHGSQLLPNLVTAVPPYIPVERATCLDCPTITELPHENLKINLDTPNPLLDIDYTPYPVNYQVTRNGALLEEGTVYETRNIIFRELNIDLEEGFYCLSIQGDGDASICAPVEVCKPFYCPEITLEAIDGKLHVDVYQTGIPVLYKVTVEEVSGGSPQVVYSQNVLTLEAHWSDVLDEINIAAGETYIASYKFLPESNVTETGCQNYTPPVDITACDLENPSFKISDFEVNEASSPSSSDGSILITSLEAGEFPYEALWSNGQQSSTNLHLHDVEPGYYCVTVTDANGCTDVGCAELLWDCTNQDGNFDNDNDGTETMDLNNGEGNENNNAMVEECWRLSVITTGESSPNSNDGSISTEIVPISGGPAPQMPYYFYWDDLQEVTTEAGRSGLAPGMYCVTVTDSNPDLCCEATACVFIEDGCENIDIQVPEVQIVQPTACNSTDGSISIDPSQISGGSGPYTLDWTGDVEGPTLSQIGEGDYTLRIIDINGCISYEQYSLSSSSPLNVSTNQTNPNNPSCDGSIEVSINSLPDAPYSIKLYQDGGLVQSIYGSNNIYTFNSLCAGEYTIEVGSFSGCTESVEIDLSDCGPIYIEQPTVTNVSGCQQSNGSIDFGSLEPTTGAAPYTYQWSNGATSLSIADLELGQYTLTITDSNNCTTEYSWTINMENQFGVQFSFDLIDIVPDFENNCAGEVTVQVQYNGSSPYIYVENTNTGEVQALPVGLGINQEVTFSNLCGDTYLITASTETNIPPLQVCAMEIYAEVPACSSFNFTAPPQITFPSNCRDDGGSISYPNTELNPTGGVAPYTWFWSNGSNDEYAIDHLTPGIYSVTVVDANGCSIEETFDLSVTNDPSLTQVEIIQQPTVGNCDGVIQVSGVTGIIVTLTHPNGEEETLTLGSTYITIFNNLCEGDYVLTAGSRLMRCTHEIEFTLHGCEEVVLGSMDVNPPTGCDTNDGSIQLLGTISGGTPSYTFALEDQDENNYPAIGENSLAFYNLPSGNYTLTVTDAEGCETEFTYELPGGSTAEILADYVQAECEDLFNGELSVGVVPSNGPGSVDYTFELYLNTVLIGTVANENVGEFTDLETGLYDLVITSEEGEGCVLEVQYFIPQIDIEGPFELDITEMEPTCPFQDNGNLTANVSGGNSPYDFEWDNGENTQTALSLNAGQHCVTVTDDCGRQLIQCANVSEFDEMNLSTTAIIDCPGNGRINLNVSGGLAPYTFQWSNGQTTQNATNLNAQQYCVTVTDANGCYQETCATALNYPQIEGTATLTNDCGGYASGNIDLSITGGDGPFTYQWNTGATSQDVNVEVGAYFVTVTDSHGCSLVGGPFQISNGLGDFATTNPCGINITCNGGVVDFIPEEPICDYSNPISCTIYECYCPVTNQYQPPQQHDYLDVYVDWPNCNIVGVCPGGGTEIIVNGFSDVAARNIFDESCVCIECEVVEVCNFPGVGIAHNPQFHAVTAGLPNPQVVASCGSGSELCEYGGFCSSVPIHPSGTVCAPCPQFNDDDDSGLVSSPQDIEQQNIFSTSSIVVSQAIQEELSPENSRLLDLLSKNVDVIFEEKNDHSDTDIFVGQLQMEHSTFDYKPSIKPNPFKDQIQIDIYLKESNTISIKLMNILGEQILSKKINASKGSNEIKITTPEGLPDGVYLIQTNDGLGNQFTSKIIHSKN